MSDARPEGGRRGRGAARVGPASRRRGNGPGGTTDAAQVVAETSGQQGALAEAGRESGDGRDATPEAAWFVASSRHPVREGNAVTAFVDGDGYFADLAARIGATTGPDSVVELVDWDLDIAFELVPGDPTTTLVELLTAASARGVPVRALLNQHQANPFGSGTVTGYDNTRAADFINALPTGAAIHDDRYLYAGTHHQKIAVVGSPAGLVAYSGGMDLNPDRLTSYQGRTRHDVQVRVDGPAAYDHHRLVADRWSEHPAASRLPKLPDPAMPGAAGRLPVQVVATTGNGAGRAAADRGSPAEPSSSGAGGDRSLARLVMNGLARAQRYIYLEDQYLVNMAVSDALQEALRRIERLVILIPTTPEVNGQLLQGWRRRKAFLAPLLRAAPEKVTVCAGMRYYVHSKLWVFDDEFAVIGSANCNRRGFSHDSEQAVGVRDAPDDGGWVRHLRMQLWAKHLALPEGALGDPLAAAGHWSALPEGAAVAPYDPDAGTDNPPFPRGTDFIWDSIIDPDGP